MNSQQQAGTGRQDRMPTFFVPHGAGPCFFMDWNPPDTWNRLASFLKGWRTRCRIGRARSSWSPATGSSRSSLSPAIRSPLILLAEFDDWLSAAVESPAAQRSESLRQWARAPHARLCHPPGAEEHLLPLLVATGAAGDSPGRKVYSERIMETTISAFRFG